MKWTAKNSYIVLFVTLLVLLGSLFFVGQKKEVSFKAYAFLTLGLDQMALSNEASSWELQRAAEHFSDLVLGWTVEPKFKQEFVDLVGGQVSYSGRRQEKQNLLFEFSGPELGATEPAEQFVSLIEGRLSEYNTATKSSYLLALKKFSLVEALYSGTRVVLGATLLAFVVSISLLLLWPYVFSARH